jgi:hypothetical protein
MSVKDHSHENSHFHELNEKLEVHLTPTKNVTHDLPDFLLDGKDSMYCTSLEFYTRIKGISPKEKAALIKFLNLSEDATIDVIAEAQWKKFESFEKSEEIWESVASVKEYIDNMIKFLSGKLMRSPSHGCPLDNESYLILPELMRLTQLGCPTFDSQPWEINYTYDRKEFQQLPYLMFFCPTKMAPLLQEELAKKYTVMRKGFNQKAVLNLHPRNKEKDFSTLTSIKNSEGKWVPDEPEVSEFVENLTSDEVMFFENATQDCQKSCEKDLQENYTCVVVVGTEYSNAIFANIISLIEKLTH